MYGQTECIRVCYLEPELIVRKPTSIGQAIPGTEAFVLNDEGRPAKAGETGILHVRGPHLMQGYWRAPELTADKLVGDGVMSTHDHFTVDEDGDLYFVDRTDDVIKTRGEKVSSVEVENALHEIDGVRQAAVIGVPDDLLGQAVRAYVVLQEEAELNEQQIIRVCRSKLENFMVPRDVVLVEELPQTESGKVRKKSLVDGGPRRDLRQRAPAHGLGQDPEEEPDRGVCRKIRSGSRFGQDWPKGRGEMSHTVRTPRRRGAPA